MKDKLTFFTVGVQTSYWLSDEYSHVWFLTQTLRTPPPPQRRR